MSISYEKVLKYWLGEDLNSLKSEIYMHNPKLWFQLKKTTDDQINSLFGETLTKAEKDSLPDDWKSNPRGQIALIILFDQFSRNVYRGTKDMFKNDEKALKIALELVDNKPVFDQLSSIEKFFVYLTLLHTENVDLAKRTLDAIERLSQEAPTLQKHHFTKYYNSSKVHYELLLKYGRYPHRNLLLGRESSQDELDFLQKSKHTFVRSVLPLKDPNSDKKPQANKKNDINKRLMLPYQRLLFLHGFRQSANKLRKRLSFMINRMKTDCNAHVTFINGTHPYRPNGDTANQMESTLGPNVLMPIESQRIWFNSDDNAQVYNGIDESIAYILTHVNLHGPYDGIIGFGQGAALASILVAKHPNLFSYLISISGFQPRSIVHKDLISESKPLKIPSLHIYGKSDILITPSRSELFSKCFVESQIAEHPAGHFAPNSWPIDRLTEFVKNQAENLKFPKSFASNQPLEISVVKLEEALVRYDLDKLDLAPLFQSDWARNLIRSDLYINYFENKPEKSSELLINEFKSLKNDENLEDKILIIHVLLIRAKDKEKNSETKEYTYSILNIFLSVYYLNAESKRDFFHENIIHKLFINLNKWKELILLCDLSYRVDGDDEKKKSLRLLYDFLIKLFVNQLAVDLSIVDRKNRTCLVQMLTSLKLIDENKSNINEEETELRTSDLSKHMPRIKSHIDKQSRIARECANLINPFEHLLNKNDNNDQDSYQVAKILSYNHYRKVLTNICAFADSVRIEHEFSSPNVHLSTAKFNRAAMEHLMKAPLSDAIINPVPEPVDVSSYEQMKPLYDWLAQNITLDEADLKFLRGTVTTDGRLDLCKQVIGPQGIKPLLDAMKGSKQVDRLLLGNNIIGDGGGKIIADFIRSGKSPLTVWYIAGNHLTVDGITPICEALKHDSQVTALWLKRNPLKPVGMRPIADLFKYNRTIEVLDLLNCGLLDEGVTILFDSLEENNPLKHVYLSANGITSVGLQSIAEFYRRVESNLETLFLGCNRIENRGAEIIGDILKRDKKLVRLNVASSRIGSEGMRSIAEALLNHPSLMNLDMGYTRSTMDLGELGNFIEDEGAIYLANVIGKTDKLISLSITHNHITQRGMQLLVDALEFNNSLLQFDYVQFGTSLNEITLTQMRAYLGRNRFLLKQNKPDFDPNAVLLPEHVKQVYSVYRTH